MRIRTEKTTLKKWMLKMIFAIFLLIAVMVLTIPWFIGKKMRQQIVEDNEKLLEVYMEFLDTNMESINKVLSQYAVNTWEISVLARSEDELERYMAKQDIMRRLKESGTLYNVFDGIFVYSKSRIEDTFLCQLGQRGNGRQLEEIKEIMEDFDSLYAENAWVLVPYGGRDYIMRVVTTGSTSCGVWLDVKSLELPLDTAEYEEMGTVLFFDREGHILSSKPDEISGIETMSFQNGGAVVQAEDGKYLQIHKSSRVLPLSMAVLIPEGAYFKEIYVIQNMIGLLLGLSLLIFPVLWRSLSKSVTAPVNELVKVMNEVERGNLNVRIVPQSRFREFEEMDQYFNSMVSELKRLSEDVYERQIREQKIQLQYLQTQIRPHFFLNSLNVIHSFSLVGRNDLIEKMVVCLSKYFNYRFKSTDLLVSLGEEKEHIENYLELYRLRYKEQFLCSMEIEEVLLEAKLPPLIIQTFVENSLKYGMSKKKVFELEIVAETIIRDSEQKLMITVTDNGPGYEQTVLEAVEKGETMPESHGQGIGIDNVVQRLKLIYGKRAEVNISNEPGACSRIVLPLEFIEEGAWTVS